MKQINKAAVLGAGVMGSTIAAHLANAGIPALLLDMVPQQLTDAEKKAGLTMSDPAVRNRIAAAGLEGLKKMKPAPFFLPSYSSLIEVGNFDDDIKKLRDCDWIIEAVVEKIEIKKQLFADKVVPNLKDGTILSTNTSGLSVNEMAEVLPENVRKNFLVTHFFNPPRYMRLLEIVPCRSTDPATVDALAAFIAKRLGKGIVYAKDTPNFVANRIGVFAMCNSIRNMMALDMSVEEVDAVAGPATGRPKTAAFRTADLVGIDVLQHAAHTSALANDEERETFVFPDFMKEMVAKGILGNKTRQGFYRKTEGENGSSSYYYYDYKTGEYVPPKRPKFASLEAAKLIEDPAQRLQAVVSGEDKAAQFAWRCLRDTLVYSCRRVQEIADDVVNIDNAMKWGFHWELGPFEMLDAVGVKSFVERAKKDGVQAPDWVKAVEHFYKFENGKDYYYCLRTNDYREVPHTPDHVDLTLLRKNGGMVEKNSGASILDLSDGVFCLEFHSKMNAIGNDTLVMLNKAIKRAEQEGSGLVIANNGKAFSAGANLALLAMGIAEGAYDEIGHYVSIFQKAMMGVKYSRVPVVAAPHSLALGGGCEICLHADAMNPHAETYMGLVEIGVGLLPAGGGTKEMSVRAIQLAEENETDVTPFIFKNFKNIGMARVSTSAEELREMGFMRHGDTITMDIDKRIHDAKQKVLALAANYRPRRPHTDLKAPGRSIAASIKAQLWNMRMGGYITEYEQFLGSTIADVITGGDVAAGTLITEEYLLGLEREAFLKLCGQKKTLERIQHMLKRGKPLRN